MNCIAIRRLLSAYIDDQTTDKERLTVGLHLSRCHECRQRHEELRRLRLALLGTPRVPVPADFAAGWRAGIRREIPQRKPARRIWPVGVLGAIPAAACLILIATGLAIFHPFYERGQSIDRAKGFVSKELASSATPAQDRDQAVVQERIMEKPPGSRPAPSVKARVPVAEAPISDKAGDILTRAAPAPDMSRAATALVGEGTGRAASTGTRSASGAETAGQAVVDGSWRIWLTSIGPRPTDLKRALAEAELLRGIGDMTSLDVPLLLKAGLSFSVAQELAQRLEEAGGHVLVELVPENLNP